MKCPKCQFKNSEEIHFFGKCGSALKESAESTAIECLEPQSYTPKFLADKILTSRSSIEGERKLVTVLFADVANYTSMSEKLDPEVVHQIMDGCFKILMDEIHTFKGTINQFTGDGVMALFGAPIALEDHAQKACHAALAIQETIKKYSKRINNKYGVDFKIRIGLNSGPVVVGAIGDDLRMDYTAVGDTTNLSARMESLAKPGTVLISHNTYTWIGQQFVCKSLGRAEMKGKEESQEIYELIKDKVYRPRVGIERQIFSEMVGRNKELDQLEIQVLKTINGEGSIVNIIGEAGIGKSRLMAELKNRDVMKRTTLLEGQGVSMGRNLSFHPIIDLLKHWARISEDDDETTAFNKLEIAVRRVHREEADEVIPFVATLMGMKLFGRYAERVKGIEGEALEKLVSKNIRELLIKGTEASPIVIIIEDLHWADTSSIELLEYLFSIVTTHRILFVNVFRPLHKETCHRIIQFLKDKFPEHYVEIKLQPLDEQMSECLINNMLNITWHHHSLIDQIVDRSGGNPFFIEEVVRSFIDIGAVIKKNGGFEVTDKIDTMVIPHTINDVLMARIDRLDENSRYVVKVASVIGRSFFYRILSEVARQIDDLDSRLSYLIEIQLIRDRMRIEELEYFFKHALAQEVAYESILHQKRKKIHLEVAKAIEKAFDKKLHEFYGILALHYIKGRDYERAELYLIKAGEEALRSSASNEALNYYQKGLDLYLNSNKDATDPERLAMFEKNIANALYNKCRWVEAVPHFNKVFEYWNIPIYPNKIVILIKFVKNIVTVVTGFDRPFIKQKPHPTQRDNEFFDLIYKRSSSLFYFDEIQMLFDALRTFNKVVKIDIARSTSAINIFIGTAGLLALGGLSFKIPRKLLHISNTQMDRKNIKNVMVYNFWDAVFNSCTGNWEKFKHYEETIIESALKNGDLFNVTNYLWFYTLINAEMGNFINGELGTRKLAEIADTFNYDLATLYVIQLKIELFFKKLHFNEALAESERGLAFSSKHSTELHQLHILAYKAEAQIQLKDEESAKKTMLQAATIVDQYKSIPSPMISPFLVTQFHMDINLLKRAISSKNKGSILKLKKRVFRSGQSALKILKKYPLYRPKAFKMMGEYYWLIGKQDKALKWWNKSIKDAEKLSSRLHLSRTYFEIGKSLMKPDSQYKELNGITAKEYLQKARTMFEEMDLQYDLDELYLVMAAR